MVRRLEFQEIYPLQTDLKYGFQHFAGSAEGPQVVNFGYLKATYRKLRMCFSLQPQLDSRLQGYRKGVQFEVRKWCVVLNFKKLTLSKAFKNKGVSSLQGRLRVLRW